MDLGLTDRVYLVTGGSKGLGFATASALVADGARVVVSSRSPDNVSSAVDTLGENAMGIAGDNADPDLPDRLVDAALRRFGRLDGLLVSVGGPPTGGVLDTSVREPLDNLASSNGVRPGLAMVAKTLANEVGPRGIRVVSLLPGAFWTARGAAVYGDPAVVERRTAGIPLRRIGDPDEFGRVAAFVLSPAASYLTGTTVTIDGGGVRGL